MESNGNGSPSSSNTPSFARLPARCVPVQCVPAQCLPVQLQPEMKRLGVTKEFDCQRSIRDAIIVTAWQITASTTSEMPNPEVSK
jgi:hypothetical protein